MNTLIFSLHFLNAEVAIVMLWDMTTNNQDGRGEGGLASFFGTMDSFFIGQVSNDSFNLSSIEQINQFHFPKRVTLRLSEKYEFYLTTVWLGFLEWMSVSNSKKTVCYDLSIQTISKILADIIIFYVVQLHFLYFLFH